MERLVQKLKKNWIRVWLIVIAFACCSFIGYAVYTEVSSVKRVVSTTNSPGDPFSSNCMKTTLTSHRLPTSEFLVSVCNFDQDFPKKYSTSDISYYLEAELKVKINNDYKTFAQLHDMIGEGEGHITQALYDSYVGKAANYTIFKSEDDVAEVTVNTSDEPPYNTFTRENNFKVTLGSQENPDTLKANQSSTDVYTVRIDADDFTFPDALFFVFVTAKPSGDVLRDISARLYGTENQEDGAASWGGSITESDYATVDYDFYNYVITGSGVGNVDILWNPEYIIINKFFLTQNNLIATPIDANHQKYGSTFEDGIYVGWKMVTIPVDSRNVGRYELQLYKVEEGSMVNPSSYIACKFTPSQS